MLFLPCRLCYKFATGCLALGRAAALSASSAASEQKSWTTIDSPGALRTIHFHHPSEEEITGKRYAMVAHLVHKNSQGKLAVVAVLVWLI